MLGACVSSQTPPEDPVASALQGISSPETNARIPQIRACFEKNRAENRGAPGTVKTQLAVSPEGAVDDAWVVESTLKAPATETCIVEAVRTWKLPEPPAGAMLMVLAFAFSS